MFKVLMWFRMGGIVLIADEHNRIPTGKAFSDKQSMSLKRVLTLNPYTLLASFVLCLSSTRTSSHRTLLEISPRIWSQSEFRLDGSL